ncbi:hypothetical protein L195_g005197 [Trifolium pratense]|uniref:Uncharacterized protein n=1 Tax=Trifolium pratense TaxID=57577 RepID=A0A2K3P041_TRIPR|nr:hypothetical protein L195_g005197 [Trifolium pratense]
MLLIWRRFYKEVHNLPVVLMAEKVGTKLANYIGAFVEYDKNNNSSFWRQYMRLRVRVDVRHPLKKDSRVKNKGGEWCTVKFNELRAEPQRRNGRRTSQWLMEEGGGSRNSGGGGRNTANNYIGGLTHSHDANINATNNNHNHSIIIPVVTPINGHQLSDLENQ